MGFLLGLLTTPDLVFAAGDALRPVPDWDTTIIRTLQLV